MTTTRATTRATRLSLSYVPSYLGDLGAARDAVLPAELLRLADGRVLCRYQDGREHIFGSLNALAQVHPWRSYDRLDDTTIEAPPLPATYAVHVDWAEIHAAADAVDQARNGTQIGYDGVVDAYGGSYSYVGYSTLADLVRLADGTAKIASDAWHVVHAAREHEDGIERARQACRVAIACARLFSLLYAAGLIADPKARICGTGPGYGLTGLHWLAGSRYDQGATSEEVERFAAGGPLPEVARG